MFKCQVIFYIKPFNKNVRSHKFSYDLMELAEQPLKAKQPAPICPLLLFLTVKIVFFSVRYCKYIYVLSNAQCKRCANDS